MQTINLKQYYPFCKEDIFVEVSDEIVEAFLLDKRAEAARDRRMFRYKAFYSLDCNDGIENAAIGWAQPSPEDYLIEKEELRKVKESQDALKLLIGDEYSDFNLVIAHDDGRPYEERQISKMLKNLIEEFDLPPVVFHSLRHCSASLKLQIGGGNIKAVQGDTGHAQSRMVTDLYAHINHGDRIRLAQKMDKDFFQNCTAEKKNAAADEAELAYQLLQNNPDIAKLLIAAMQKN